MVPAREAARMKSKQLRNICMRQAYCNVLNRDPCDTPCDVVTSIFLEGKRYENQ